jgi:hypothetical protein
MLLCLSYGKWAYHTEEVGDAAGWVCIFGSTGHYGVFDFCGNHAFGHGGILVLRREAKMRYEDWTMRVDVETRHELVAQRIIERLPHGNGIDYRWNVYSAEERIVCANEFEAMNEAGMYCHVYPFSITFSVDGADYTIEDVDIIDGVGCECGYGLQEHLEELLWECLDYSAEGVK